MQEHRVVVSRTVTSKRFAPVIEKSIRERINDFAEVRQLLSLYPFSADYSVKAAMGGTKRTGGSSRNAAADNKAKRQKELKFTRLGIYCYDPKATRKPNQYFETKPRWNLDGQMGDVANVGWLDIPKSVEPDKYNQEVQKYFVSKQNEPKVIARPAKKNKRTGQLEVKALGQSIGRGAGNIGQAAARAVGIILDADGRMRCPPGVPAANQFTDEVGSNCFDFTPAIGRALVEMAKRASAEILEEVASLDGAISIMRDDDGNVFGVPRGAAARVRGGLSSRTRRIPGPMGELLGPDGKPIEVDVPPSPDFDRDVADLAAASWPIEPDEYEDVFEDMIRKTYPELSTEKIKELTKAAVRRQNIRDKQRKDVQEVLDFAKELGVEIDPTDPNSVQEGLAKMLHLLRLPENGGWGANFKSYFGSRFGSGSMSIAMAEHKERQIRAILSYLMTDPQKFGFTKEELTHIINTKFKGSPELLQQSLMKVMTSAKTAEEVFGKDAAMFKMVFEVTTKWDKMRQQEAGLLIGLIKARKNNPKLMDGLKKIMIGMPSEYSDDAICYTDESGGFKILLNPLQTVMRTEADIGIDKSEYTLFEPDGSMGTEVAKLRAIGSSIDRVGAERARDAYLQDLETIGELEAATESASGYQQFWLTKNAGQVGAGMYIINHELTHGRQLMLIQNYLKSIPGLSDSMDNEQMMLLAEGLLAGNAMPSLFGRDWDYASIISNPDWLAGAMSNMPQIMQVLLGKNMGGKYAMNHYWQAAHRAPFLSELIQDTDDLYKHLYELRQKIEKMQPNSAEYEAAIEVFNEMAEIYKRGDPGLLEISVQQFRKHSALTIAEMQAEISAGVDSGLIDMTPEIEAFLAPIRHGSDIGDNYGMVNPDAKPVVRNFKDEIKQGIKNTITGRKARARAKARREAEKIPTIEGAIDLPGVEVVDSSSESDKEVARRLLGILEGMRSRSDVSQANSAMRQVVLDAATEKQKKLLDGNWRGSMWNTSDPTDWSRALRSRPNEVVNAVENQFIPFMDLVDSSEIPTDTIAEIQLPSRSLGLPGEQIGTKFEVGKHFTALIHSAEDIGPNENVDAQRVLLIVPEGSTGLPDYTPGTQRGEVGSLIMPPGEIEIIGRTNDGVAIGQISSQKTPEQQLNELRQTLHSLGTSESRPLGQRIAAKRAENRIERRQELARVGKAQAAVAMEMDPQNSRLAEKIEYDPQTRTLKVSYRNGNTREFENVPYGKVRDAGASNKPDKLISELEKTPQIYDPNRRLPTSSGLRSSTVNEINAQSQAKRANQKTVDILARANDIGVDMDRQERDIVPRLRQSAKKERLNPATISRIKDKTIAPSLSAQNKEMVRGLAATEQTPLEILRQVPGDDTFGQRLEILREISDVRGDLQLVGQIDDFIKEIQAMSPEQFDEAVEEAMDKFESPFDSRPTVMMSQPIGLINVGRYETVHQGRETQGGKATGFDVPAIRRAAEAQLLNFSGDTDSETTSLRPSSAMTLHKIHGKKRAEKLRSIYGDDVEIQHSGPSVGKSGKQAAQTGTGKQTWNNAGQYGANTVVLKPEVADRTLAINGDSVSDVSTSGTDVLEPGARLSKLSEDGQLASMFFDPLAVLFETKTGRNDTIASAVSNAKKRYVESLTVGSFELSDVESIVSSPFGLRGEHVWDFGKTNMIGSRPETSFTNLIAAARQKDDLFEKHGIDVVIDHSDMDLDEVEPFNVAMTKKWVEKQISVGKFKDVKLSDVIANEQTTPYEALLRYRKLNAERGGGLPIFDHPNNESGGFDSPKNTSNFISMIDEELDRINPEIGSRGLASSTASPRRGKLSKEANDIIRFTPTMPEDSVPSDDDWDNYLASLNIEPPKPRQLVKVNTVEQAVMAVLDGHDVDMPDIEGAHTLIDDFARLVVTLEQMAHDGEITEDVLKNFVFDLCQVTVRGTSAFCLGNKGIPRYLMPQALGEAIPGTTAAEWLARQNAERVAKGEKPSNEVDGTKDFIRFLKANDLAISEPTTVRSDKLKATQRDMQGHKVAGMLAGAKRGKFDKKTGTFDPSKKWNPGENPIFISNDGYVIDGHHRWAAQLGMDFLDGILGNDHEMGVIIVDAPISKIIRLANQWTEEFGIAKKPVAKRTDANPAYSREVLKLLRDSRHLGGEGKIDWGYIDPRDAIDLAGDGGDLAKATQKVTRGLASSTDGKNIKPTYPRNPSYGPMLGEMNDIFEGVKDWDDFKKRYDELEIVFLDYETTGLKFDEWNFSKGNGNVTQIGAVKVKNGKVIGRFETYVNPGMPSSEWEEWSRNNLKDYDGNPVTDEFLKNKPSVAEAHRKLAEFAGPNALMGVQNAAFDKNVLEDALREHGIDWKTRGWIDLKDMAAMTLPRWSKENPDGPFRFNKKTGENVASNSLADITKYLGVELGDKHHTADADAEATAESMKKLINGAIDKGWSKEVLNRENRENYVKKQQDRFEEEIKTFETAKTNYLNKRSETSGLSSSTSDKKPDSGRTTSEKINMGPAELPNGRDNLGLPVVASTEKNKTKFGTSRRQIAKYFKKNYGIEVEVPKSAMNGKKHPEFQAATYASLQALDDLLLNVPGIQELLKDNDFSINITDGGIEGRSPLSIPTGVLGTFGPRAKIFKTQRFSDGEKHKTRIDVNVHEVKAGTAKLLTRDWVNYYPGLQEGRFVTTDGQLDIGFIPRGNTTGGMFQIIVLPKFDETYTVPEVGGNGKPVPVWRRQNQNILDPQKVQKLENELNARLAYSTMVHEFGHLLDFSQRDKSKQQVKIPSYLSAWWANMTDRELPKETVTERAKRIAAKLFGGDGESIYESSLRADEIGKISSPTGYGATKTVEALAEAFAAWFLFARAPKIRTTPARRTTTTDLRGEQTSVVERVPGNPKPMELAAGILAPLLEKLGPRVKSAKENQYLEIDDLDPLVVLYTMLPLFMAKETSGKISRRRTRRINKNNNEKSVKA